MKDAKQQDTAISERTSSSPSTNGHKKSKAASDADSSAEEKSSSKRLTSLDALRGFDMFWIVGGVEVIRALNENTDWGWLAVIGEQVHHTPWNGFQFWDLVFPLFLFISGVTMPFSLTKHRRRGENKSKLYWRVFRRGMLLVLLGWIHNGLLNFDWAHMRYPSVLGRIGLAYLFAALIVLNTDWRKQIAWMVGILLAYWAAMRLIPVPVDADVYSMQGNLASYIDRHVLPGTLYKDIHDPEGLLSTIPAISTALMGALAGYVLRYYEATEYRKVGIFTVAGIVCLALGLLWHPFFPINKNLWTSSFVLYTGGWSLLLLAAFYLVIDVWGYKKWAFFFVVIGLNPITIYMAAHGIVNFRFTANFFFGGLIDLAATPFQPALVALGALIIEWLVLYVMYRKRIFLKV